MQEDGKVQRSWCRLSLVPTSTHSWGRTRLPPIFVSIVNYDSAIEPVHVRAAWYYHLVYIKLQLNMSMDKEKAFSAVIEAEPLLGVAHRHRQTFGEG